MAQNMITHSGGHHRTFRLNNHPLYENGNNSYRSKISKIDHYLQMLMVCKIHHSITAHVAEYLKYLLRRNCSPNTIKQYFLTIKRLAVFLKALNIQRLEHISRDNLGAFIEYLQDIGLMPTSINTQLTILYIFFGFLIEKEVLTPQIMKNRFRLKVPDELPKAIDPEDIHKTLSVIETPREKALILVLLRTGMRIGELLNTRLEDIDIAQRKIQILEAQKNHEGRVVYMSEDACNALKDWFGKRDPNQPYVFYGYGSRKRLSYARARVLFINIMKKAGLLHKKYTLHCLRHTFASELLNAGMRLECLQVLLGHQNIEVTRRYARLTDNTRKQEYYKAMERIERGEVNGHYRFHN